jgi:hypothetical protein
VAISVRFAGVGTVAGAEYTTEAAVKLPKVPHPGAQLPPPSCVMAQLTAPCVLTPGVGLAVKGTVPPFAAAPALVGLMLTYRNPS